MVCLGSGTGCANLLDFGGFGWHGQAYLAQKKKFLRFLESCSDNYLQNNLKTNKRRLNAWVASHEALV